MLRRDPSQARRPGLLGIRMAPAIRRLGRQGSPQVRRLGFAVPELLLLPGGQEVVVRVHHAFIQRLRLLERRQAATAIVLGLGRVVLGLVCGDGDGEVVGEECVPDEGMQERGAEEREHRGGGDEGEHQG